MTRTRGGKIKKKNRQGTLAHKFTSKANLDIKFIKQSQEVVLFIYFSILNSVLGVLFIKYIMVYYVTAYLS